MLQVARLASRALEESSPLVAAYLESRIHSAGGFCDRAGEADLYYTAFGLSALLALQVELAAERRERMERFLMRFTGEEPLDLVHLASLARAWASLGLEQAPRPIRARLTQGLSAFRAADGGGHVAPGRAEGSAYGAFLLLGAYQDLGAELPDPERLAAAVQGLRRPDGSFPNEGFLDEGSTNATAAALTVLRSLGEAPARSSAEWLELRAHPGGGFVASPRTPIPDLLSTATALHALSGMGRSVEPHRERCLDFLDTLWTAEGGFHGHWADDVLDCEYTFYGLLALGHLYR